ncbi:hypothetical protein [Halosolutus halophilus]|uniref:hypothetical protein n=1 Tax=Halosolutus halophilus TaxID=1552990 RepID=UPI002235269F|nr:hypothetical protein [Halosolutus halophilus]
MKPTRRTQLTVLGSTAAIESIGTATAREQPSKGRIRTLGHALLSDPPGGYTERDVRDDGQDALTGKVVASSSIQGRAFEGGRTHA